MARKVSDEFTVPLCAIHHDELHRFADEVAWWKQKNVEPLAIAEKLWQKYSKLCAHENDSLKVK